MGHHKTWLVLLLITGCGEPTPREGVPSGGVETEQTSEVTPTQIDAEAALVDIDFEGESFQIFSYEASVVNGAATSIADVVPEVSINFAQAKAACEAGGFRLCTQEEWTRACKGADKLLFGFAAEVPDKLNETCDVARTTDNTPGSLPSKTGSHADCKTTGLDLYDMIGNAAEWVESADGVAIGMGAAFYQAADGSNCEASITGDASGPLDPETQSTDTGFRCCL